MPGGPAIPSRPTPLYIVAAALALAEVPLALVAYLTGGPVQTAFTVFAMLYPSGLVVAFFWIWVKRPWLLYAPTEFESGDALRDYVATMRGDSPESPALALPTAQNPDAEPTGGPALESEDVEAIPDGTPPSTWREAQAQMFDAGFLHKSREKLAEAYESAIALPLTCDEIEVAKLMYFELRYLLGDEAALDELLALSKDGVATSKVEAAAGLCLAMASEFESSAKHYLKAAAAEDEEVRASGYYGEAYLALSKSGKAKEAIGSLSRHISAAHSDVAKKLLLEKLAEVYDQLENHEMRALVLDKVLELTSNDTGALFSAAYAYSEAKQPQLAVMCYRQLLNFKDDPMARNNLGVAYDALDLPISSIAAYQQAHDADNTLATANLADKLIGAGFAPAAEDLLRSVENRPDVHSNVHSARARLIERKQHEVDQKKEIESQARARRDFLRRYVDGMLDVDGPPPPPGDWTGGPLGGTETSLEDGAFRAMSSSGLKAQRLDGAVTGRAARITVEAGTPKLFGEGLSYSRDGEGFAVYETATDTIHVLVLGEGKADRLFVLERVNS